MLGLTPYPDAVFEPSPIKGQKAGFQGLPDLALLSGDLEALHRIAAGSGRGRRQAVDVSVTESLDRPPRLP
jgi:hypothetical protein